MKAVRPRWEDLRNHLYYRWITYLVLLLVTSLAWSLLFSVSEPKVKLKNRVEILFTGLSDHDEAQEWIACIQNTLVGDRQEADYVYVPANEQDSASTILFMRMEGREGDLLLIPYAWFEYLASEGALIPLTTATQDGGQLIDMLELPGDFDLDYGYANFTDADTGETTFELCGVPMGTVKGLKDLGIDPDDKIACIAFYSQNAENDMRALKWIMDNKKSQEGAYWDPLDLTSATPSQSPKP